MAKPKPASPPATVPPGIVNPDLATLLALQNQPKEVAFELNGTGVKFGITPLSLSAYQHGEMLVKAVKPPLTDPKDPFSFNEDDPEYQRRRGEVVNQRDCHYIQSCTTLQFSGTTLVEQAASMASALTAGLVTHLVDAILDAYASRIPAMDLANFTSGAPSPGAPNSSDSPTESPSPANDAPSA